MTLVDEMLTPEGLSARYKGALTIKALANMRSEGKGPPYIKIGRTILYPLTDVRAWEAARRMLTPNRKAPAVVADAATPTPPNATQAARPQTPQPQARPQPSAR